MVSTSHASTHASTHLSHPSTHTSTHSTHGSIADTLALIDRGTPHQSEASRSDTSLGHDDSISSSSTTRGADDDNGNPLFDAVFDHPDNDNDNYTTSASSTAPDTNTPSLRNMTLSAAAVGNMGGQFAGAGAGEGMTGEEGDGVTLGLQQQPMMLEDGVVVPAAGGQWSIEDAVRVVRQHRAEMSRARWDLCPGTGEVRYIRGGHRGGVE